VLAAEETYQSDLNAETLYAVCEGCIVWRGEVVVERRLIVVDLVEYDICVVVGGADVELGAAGFICYGPFCVEAAELKERIAIGG
jgi:hypothetical protein